MSNLNVVQFAPNIPQQLSLREVEGQLLTGRFSDQVYFQLSDGRGMVLDSETAAKLGECSFDLQDGACSIHVATYRERFDALRREIEAAGGGR